MSFSAFRPVSFLHELLWEQYVHVSGQPPVLMLSKVHLCTCESLSMSIFPRKKSSKSASKRIYWKVMGCLMKVSDQIPAQVHISHHLWIIVKAMHRRSLVDQVQERSVVYCANLLAPKIIKKHIVIMKSKRGLLAVNTLFISKGTLRPICTYGAELMRAAQFIWIRTFC